jgi:hypothetical protein
MKEEKIAKLEQAISECERFSAFAKLAIKRIEADEMACFGSKETATAKRASMDVTRALANLRKP